MGLLIRYDLQKGLLSRWKLFWPILLMPFLFGTELFARADAPSFLDAVMYYFKGMAPFSLQENRDFSIPFEWLLFQLYVLFLTSAYPTADLNSNGIQLLVRTKVRHRFWLSKCVWNACTVIAAYWLYWCGIAAVVLLRKGNLISLPNEEFCLLVSGLDIADTSVGQLTFVAFLLPLLSTMALGAVQQAMSLWLQALPAYVVTVVVLASSAFWSTSLLIGNHSMLLRTVGSESLFFSALMDVVLVVVATVCGLWRFIRYDILG